MVSIIEQVAEMLERSPRLGAACGESHIRILCRRLKGSLRSLADGNVNGDLWYSLLSFSSRVSPSVNTLEREELEVILLIEPAALEKLQGQASSSGQCECIDHELDVRVRFFSRFRLVVEDMDVTVADLEEIDMASDHVIV